LIRVDDQLILEPGHADPHQAEAEPEALAEAIGGAGGDIQHQHLALDHQVALRPVYRKALARDAGRRVRAQRKCPALQAKA
jgi:hypothetical protein